MLNLKNYRSILCLNGSLPSADFFMTDLPIIAADGATNHLMQMGVMPNIVIGDLDSVLPEYLNRIASHYHYDQNFCDFEKSVQYLEKEQLLPAIIVGINGGYLDHILNNVNLFLKTGCLLFSPPIWGFVFDSRENPSLTFPLNTKISLFGIPHANITTTGLRWNLCHDDLLFPGKTSCFNRTQEQEIRIDVHTGAVLILVYLDKNEVQYPTDTPSSLSNKHNASINA